MSPVSGVIIYLVVSSIVTMIAVKKGRSGLACLATLLVGALVLLAALSYLSHGDGQVMGWGVFALPLGGFFWSLMTPNSQGLAVQRGSFGEFRKCPFCAESVRVEAIVCKHCGRDIPADQLN